MKQEGEFFESNNLMHSDNTMRLMLDSNDLLREVEVFIRGYYQVSKYNEETDKQYYEMVKVGEPKANDKGVQSIMFWMRTKINPLISLANISEDQYTNFLYRSRKALARNLMVQRVNYGISLSNYTELIDVIMETFEAFFTSSIKGGHRVAFTSNQKSEIVEKIENNNKKMFGVF